MSGGVQLSLLRFATSTLNPFFVQSYFAACLEDGVEDFAVDKLFRLLVPLATALPAQEAADERISESSSFPADDFTQSPPRPFARSTIELKDIFRDLGDRIKPKLGPWLVVVSQRGIKHVRKYSQDRETFARIESTMR